MVISVGSPKYGQKNRRQRILQRMKRKRIIEPQSSEAYSSKPSNLKKKAKLTAALDRLQDLQVKQKLAEEYISELSPATLGSYIKKASVDSAVKVGHAYAKATPPEEILRAQMPG